MIVHPLMEISVRISDPQKRPVRRQRRKREKGREKK